MTTRIYPAQQGPYQWADKIATGYDYVWGSVVGLYDADASKGDARTIQVEITNAPMISASEWVIEWTLRSTGIGEHNHGAGPVTARFRGLFRGEQFTYGYIFKIKYTNEFFTSGRMPPTLQARVTVRDGGTVVATRDQEWIMYSGTQRALPFIFNFVESAFEVTTPVVQVTQGAEAFADFRDRSPDRFNPDGPDRSDADRASIGSERWSVGVLNNGVPSTDAALWKPFIRLNRIESALSRGTLQDIRTQSRSLRGELQPGQSIRLNQFYRTSLRSQWRLVFDILVNAAWPQYLELRFYRRVQGYGDSLTESEYWQDVLLTTDHEPTLIVPERVTVFDGGTATIQVRYGIPPAEDVTVAVAAKTITGKAIDSSVLSVAPAELAFTPANAATPQDVVIGLAADATATVGEPAQIEYSDGTGLTAETDINTRPDESTATSAANSDLVLSVSPRAVTIEHGGSAQLQVGTTATTKAATTVRMTTEDSDLTIRPATSTIPATGAILPVQLSDQATTTDDRDTTVTAELVSAANVVLDTVTVTVRIRAVSANIPAATPGQRYQINGVLQSTDDPEAVSFEMDMAWAGESTFRDGAWRYLPGVIRPSVLTITPDMVIDVERCQIGPDSQDRINAATMQIAQDTSREYLPRRMAKLTLGAELLLDGHEREIDMGSRAFINNGWQAARTLAVMMRRTRYNALYILRVRPGPNLERYHVHPGDIVTYTDARYNVYGSRCRVIASTINPDLSMTLSLRQESPAVYQDVPAASLPAVPQAPVGGWVRLFAIPEGWETRDIAVAGGTIWAIVNAQPTGYDEDGNVTTAGTAIARSTTNRGAIAIGPSGGWICSVRRSYWYLADGRDSSDEWVRGAGTNNRTDLRNPYAMAGIGSSFQVLVDPDTTPHVITMDIDITVFEPPAVGSSEGAGAIAATSSYDPAVVDGAGIAIHPTDGDVMTTTQDNHIRGASSNTIVDTMTGQGDEVEIGRLGAIDYADGEPYVIAWVALNEGDVPTPHLYKYVNPT